MCRFQPKTGVRKKPTCVFMLKLDNWTCFFKNYFFFNQFKYFEYKKNKIYTNNCAIFFKINFTEFCRDCYISHLNINTTQYINNYNQVTTEKAKRVPPTPQATNTVEKATKNGATTKDTTHTTTASHQAAVITAATTIPTIQTLLTDTKPKSITEGGDTTDTPTTTPTLTTLSDTTKSVDDHTSSTGSTG